MVCIQKKPSTRNKHPSITIGGGLTPIIFAAVFRTSDAKRRHLPLLFPQYAVANTMHGWPAVSDSALSLQRRVRRSKETRTRSNMSRKMILEAESRDFNGVLTRY